MYHPTPEQAEADRRAAYESGVPHGYVAPGDKYRDLPSITLRVVSELVGGSWVEGRGRGLCRVLAWGAQAPELCGQERGIHHALPFQPAGRILVEPSFSPSPTHSHHSPIPRHTPLATCLQHSEDEYGEEVGPDGRHRGGPFTIQVSPKMRVEELRKAIRVSDAGREKAAGHPRFSCQQPHCQPAFQLAVAERGAWAEAAPACLPAHHVSAGQGRHHPRPAAAVLCGQEYGGLATHAGAVSGGARHQSLARRCCCEAACAERAVLACNQFVITC